jgi:hypothetical protein
MSGHPIEQNLAGLSEYLQGGSEAQEVNFNLSPNSRPSNLPTQPPTDAKEPKETHGNELELIAHYEETYDKLQKVVNPNPGVPRQNRTAGDAPPARKRCGRHFEAEIRG